MRIIQRTRRTDGGFVQISADISELSGYGFYLYFNLYNDGGGGRSWIYLDNITLEVCPGAVPVTTPDNGYNGHYKCTVDADEESEEYAYQSPNQGGPYGGGNGYGRGNGGGGYGGPNGGGQYRGTQRRLWQLRLPPHQIPPCTPTPTVTATMSSTATATPTLTPTATATTTPTLSADLSLTKSATPTTTTVESQVHFTIVVTNTGPDIATGVTVGDILSSDLTFVSSSGDYNNMTGIWNIGVLTNSTEATLLITATVNLTATSPITNIAQVQTSDVFDPDSQPGNAPAIHQDDDANVVIAVTHATQQIGISRVPAQQVQPASTPAPPPGGSGECQGTDQGRKF